MDVRQQLTEMGFPPSRIEAALRHAQDLDKAIDWLDKHEDSDEDDDEEADASSQQETKTLTEEERQAKLETLRLRAEERKKAQALIDKEQEKNNEILRRKRDVEGIKIREELEKKKAMQEAAKRKKEAREDAEAKKRIRDLIEADKRARLAKKNGQPVPEAEPARTVPVASAPAKTLTDTKIRFRGSSLQSPIIQTFALTATVGEVVEAIAKETGLASDSIKLTSSYPRKTFSHADYSLTIREAGLQNGSLDVST